LDPQIGFDLLQRAQERQNRDVTLGDRSTVFAIAKAAEPETSPTPAVIAPAATMPFFKNDRRFLRPPNTVPSFFISFSFS